jgi:diaminopimelate epimerase
MKKPFIKMHGLGNDFVIIDSRNNSYLINDETIKLISNRRFGIGCDQVIEMKDSETADIFMKIYNSDGSEAEACGNASRCVAGILFASSPKKKISIETISGIINAESEVNGNIKVDMGKPKFLWNEIPLNENIKEINFEQFSLKNGLTVNIGNPHIVFFVEDLNNININEIGPYIETDKLFPQRINIEICQIINKNKIKALIWERGAGKTLACGSGACAVLVAAYKNGLSNETAEILLDGGSLNISWNINTNKHVIMSGPVSVSFLGDFSTLGIEK